jgi:tricorn protease-like protein
VSALARSPDGTRLAVVAHEKGAASYDVYTLAARGGDVRRVTCDVDANGVAWR